MSPSHKLARLLLCALLLVCARDQDRVRLQEAAAEHTEGDAFSESILQAMQLSDEWVVQRAWHIVEAHDAGPRLLCGQAVSWLVASTPFLAPGTTAPRSQGLRGNPNRWDAEPLMGLAFYDPKCQAYLVQLASSLNRRLGEVYMASATDPCVIRRAQ